MISWKWILDVMRNSPNCFQVSSDKKSGKKLGKVKEKLYSKLNYRTENYIEKVDDKSVLRE